jgi:hypothetical protein
VGPNSFGFFFQFIQNWLNFKNQNGCLILLQKFPILHAESRKYWEQLAQLCRLQIPNRNKVRNPVIDSVFESLMNFKRDSNLQENLINSPKFLLDLIFTKVNLVRYTYVRFRVTKQVSNGLVRIKENRLNLKFKPYNI